MIRTANLGFPRMGAARELKWALERAWRGDDPGYERLLDAATGLRARHWRLQRDREVDRIPSGDFSLYDHVLDAAVAVGAVPARCAAATPGAGDRPARLDRLFAMARGGPGLPPLELTKWFDTNYHYLVPELEAGQRFACDASKAVGELGEALALGIPARPVLLGPVTFLHLAKRTDGGNPLELLDALMPVYEQLVAELAAAGATALQLDEPVLVQNLDEAARSGLLRSCSAIRSAAPGVELTVATYFGDLGPNAGVALALPVDFVHVDLVRGPGRLGELLDAIPPRLGLSLGVVDGRNVWRSDLDAAADLVGTAIDRIGEDRLQLAPSCSLLHLPVDARAETGIVDDVRSWLAFAEQRLDELTVLARALGGDDEARAAVEASRESVAAKAVSPLVERTEVRRRMAAVDDGDLRRASPHADRRDGQRKLLGLPVLPTTTIGSFPQTPEVRRLRARYRSGEIDAPTYEGALEDEVASCIRRQEELGLDVLVHGEFERTDMVEYFGERLDGFVTTTAGWVQSYGSRCVKPPILFGDVSRPEPMTLRWSTYAAGCTERPVKGMLTGPVTILQWSFVRNDQPRADTARQVALALADEVTDLEAAGIHIIQIDEPALREGLPLRRAERPAYLDWATRAFRLTSSHVADETQIHTHMCYAEFDDILDAIVELDADVLSIEASRSGMELLRPFADRQYPNEIGPGVWDIHSTRVPGPAELDELLDLAIAAFGTDRLWVNPDCGLKTRGWPEVEQALANLTAAAARARARHTV